MRRSVVGSSGLQVSALTLGTLGWGDVIAEPDVRALAETYVAAGGCSFSAAYGYGNGAAEETLGRLLGEVIPRSEAVVLTKAGISRDSGERVVDTSRGALLRQLDSSLRRLRTDYVDLWLVHAWSDLVPLAETMSALELAVSSGRARYVGVSNYVGWQLARAYSLLEAARVPLVANEIEYSLLRRDVEADGTADAAAHLGAGLLAWSPLARGVLTGKYRHTVPADSRAAARPELMAPYLDAQGRSIVEAVSTAADGLGVPPAEVSLAWLLARPSVAGALVGARTVAQLRTTLRAADTVLPVQVTEALDDVSGW